MKIYFEEEQQVSPEILKTMEEAAAYCLDLCRTSASPLYRQRKYGR